MHEMIPHLQSGTFPPLKRGQLTTLQLNLGYRCNQRCLHCHVNAGPNRSEVMDEQTIRSVLEVIPKLGIRTLDLTGGAPEMNPHFRDLVRRAVALGVGVIDRCNLSILSEPGYEWLAGFLAENQVEVVASLPCYLEENVDAQRGTGSFAASIAGLKMLNALGYGEALPLNLVYNPQGAQLPAPQQALEAAYRRELQARHGIRFSSLFTIANMPVNRFGSALISRGELDGYMGLLKASHKEENLIGVMCRSLISVDWQGYVYDCDFNQMLGLALAGRERLQLRDLLQRDIEGLPIATLDHCYGCTAGQGSSCGGALA